MCPRMSFLLPVALGVTLLLPAARGISQEIAFSLDIGSQHDLSSPLPVGSIRFDPGDVYTRTSAGGAAGDAMDDAAVYAPDPDSSPPVHAGCGAGSFQAYFDLDAFDRTRIPADWLHERIGQKIYKDEMPEDYTDGIYTPEFLAISFDDDSPRPWCDTSACVPVDSGTMRGNAANDDEILGLTLDVAGLLPFAVLGSYGAADEVTVHAGLGANPPGQSRDDDVDALDLFSGELDSSETQYFSVDFEANYGLSPGAVYAVGFVDPLGKPVPVIEPSDLGLGPNPVDLNAIAFVWLGQNPGDPLALALVFSVDDPAGGLDARLLYYSFMTGSHAPLINAPLMNAQIDAVAVWHEEVNLEQDPVNPVIPEGVTTSPQDSRVTLEWKLSDPQAWACLSFNIYRSETSGGPYALIGQVGIEDANRTGYTDEEVENGISYYYVVTSVNTAGDESEPCTEVSATPGGTVMPWFRRGDANNDARIDMSDSIFLLGWLFLGGEDPGCIAAGNANGDSAVDLSDAVYVLGHLFLGSNAPVSPFPDCGQGSQSDVEIGCVKSSCQQE
jgi:hypothetical protein